MRLVYFFERDFLSLFKVKEYVMSMQVWNKRWMGLNEYMENLIERYENPELQLERKDTLIGTIKCLQKFGASQIEFFHSGFSKSRLKESEESENFPFENVIATTMEQISYDIEVVEKAANQRIGGNDTLYKADYLAYESLKPVLPVNKDQILNLREYATVLTYFQKSTTVRIVPYAPIVLVGIPFTCKKTNQDFLAIPHEVGHHVYRHGRVNIKNIIKNKAQGQYHSLSKLMEEWFEELFADVYGALVAGPVIGMSFQDLQMKNLIEDFFTGDGSHPVPILRPYIYINTIADAKKPEIAAWTDKLRNNWVDYLQVRDEKVFTKMKKSSSVANFGEITIGDFKARRKFKLNKNTDTPRDIDNFISTGLQNGDNHIKEIDNAINIIRHLLLSDIEVGIWAPSPVKAPTINESAKDLYNKFDEFINEIPPGIEIPDLKLEKEEGIDNEATIFVGDKSTKRKLGNTGLPMEDIKKRFFDTEDIINSPDWLSVLDAGGWTVKGPDCEGTGLC